MNDKLKNRDFEYKKMFNQSLSIMLLIDPISQYIKDANRAACDFYGYSYKEITQLKISDLNILSDKEVKTAIKNAKEKKNAFYNFKHKLKNGEIKDIEVYTNIITIKNEEYLFSVIHDVTEKIQLKKILKENKEKYGQLVNNLKDCIAIYKINEKDEIIIVDFNKSAEKLENFKSEDIRGKRLIDVFPGAKEFGIIDAIKKVNRTGQAIDMPTKLYKDNNIKAWRENHIYKIETGEIIAVYRDVTEKKKIEENLKKSEEKFKLVINSIRDCIFTIDLDGKFTYLSKSFEKITKFKIEDFIGTHFINQVCPEYKGLISDNFEIGKKGVSTPLFEIEIFDKNNNRVPVELKVSPLIDESGKYIGRTGVFRDVTDRKIAQEKAKQNEETFKHLIEEAADIIVLINKHGIIKYINKVAEKITGYKQEEFIGSNFTNYIPKEDIPNTIDAAKKVLKNKQDVNIETSLLNKDGSKTPFMYHGKLFKYNGELVDMAILRDVTKQKQAEQKIIESQELYKSIFNATGTASLIIKENKEISLVNNEIENLLGWRPEEMMGQKWTKYASPKKLQMMINSHKIRRENNIEKYETILIHKNGEERNVILTGALIKGTTDSIISLSDITELKQVQKDLQQSKKNYKNRYDYFPFPSFIWEKQGEDFVLIKANKTAYKENKDIIRKMINLKSKEIWEDEPKLTECLNKCYDTKQTFSLEKKYHSKDNSKIKIINATFSFLPPNFIQIITVDITQQKQAEKKLIESEKILFEAEKIARLGYVRINHKSKKEEWSDQVFRIINEKPQNTEICHKNLIKIIHPDDTERVTNILNNSLNSTKEFSVVFRIILKNKKIKYIKGIWATTFDANGKPEITLGTVQDITKQKKYEISIKESEERYKSLFTKSKDSTLLMFKNKFIDCNLETIKFLEAKNINQILDNTPDKISPKYQPDGNLSKTKSLEMISIAYKNGYHRFEWEHKSFKNKKIFVDVSLTAIDINNRKLLYVVMRDISKRKKAETEITKLNTAITQNPGTIVITDIDGNIEYVNPAFTKTTGYTAEEAIGQNPRILASGKSTKEFYKKLWDTIKSGNVWEGQFYNKRKDNTYYWEKAVISPVKNNNGKIINFIAIKYDITAQKEAEIKAEETKNNLIILNNKYKKQNIEVSLQNKILIKSQKEFKEINRQFNSVINSSKAIIIEIDADYKIIRWNKRAVKITGILSNKIIGYSLKKLKIIEELKNVFFEILEAGLKGKTIKDKEIKFYTIKKEIKTLLISSNTKLDSNKKIIGVFIIAQDITKLSNDKKYLELKVKERTEKLKTALKKEKELNEMKTKFVSVVSHEFRTPLSAINFSANFINNYFDRLEKDKIKLKLKNIETQVSHMTKLLDDVLIMGRIQSNKVIFNPKVINCKEYFKTIIEEVYISRGQTHKIIYSENIENAKIFIDEVQGRNIFINLLSNAIKFSPKSNEVELSVNVFAKNIKITVTDTGIGIEDKESVFNPFVRGNNAENIQGTGLGLSIVKEAVKKHNGRINVKTEIGKGTSIEVFLPNKNNKK